MRSTSARSVSTDLRSFGIHPLVTPEGAFDLSHPDLSDIGIDMAELEAVNRSLAPHAAEIEAEDFAPRRSYRISDYINNNQTPPTSPARAMRKLAA